MERNIVLCYKEKEKEMLLVPKTYEQLKKNFLEIFASERPSENIVFFYSKDGDKNIIEESIDLFSLAMKEILCLNYPIILAYDDENKEEINDDLTNFDLNDIQSVESEYPIFKTKKEKNEAYLPISDSNKQSNIDYNSSAKDGQSIIKKNEIKYDDKSKDLKISQLEEKNNQLEIENKYNKRIKRKK